MAISSGQIQLDGSSSNLLWSLNAGAALVYAGGNARTVPVLDHAEDMMKTRDESSVRDRGQYHAKTYDSVMVNTYKAIAAMEVGNSALARTELIRAEDRQRIAEEEFQKEAAAFQAHNGATDSNSRSMATSARSSAEYQAAMRDMGNYGGYTPFINPFATYLTGLYFLNTADRDPERARNAFSRVRGISGDTPLLHGDYVLAEQRGKFTPKVWVIFENGQGSTLNEYSMQIPIPVIGRHSGLSVVRVAMPNLHENAPAARGLLVGQARQPTVVVGNFDYVQRSEFTRRYPSILTAAIAEVALKAVAQNLAAQEKTGVALLLTAVVSQVSTADTRSWSALPKDFHAARVETPKDGKLRIATMDGADLGTVTVPTDVSSIVYVKMVRAGSPPAMSVLRF